MESGYKILLDFDGTCVEHIYPEIGRCNFGCIEVIDKLQKAGHKIILNTLRSELNPVSFKKSIEWFDKAYMFLLKRDLDFSLKPIEVSPVKIHPVAWNLDYFMKSGTIMIDDQSFGIPLKRAVMSNGYMVDWDKLDQEFINKGIY
jgi:hypothetical protein